MMRKNIHCDDSDSDCSSKINISIYPKSYKEIGSQSGTSCELWQRDIEMNGMAVMLIKLDNQQMHLQNLNLL